MHTERLHSIFTSIIQDDGKENYTGQIQEIVQAVQTRINQPEQPDHATNIFNNVKKFREAAKNSKTNEFSLTWRKIISELNLDILVVEVVKKKIDDIFRSTSMEAEIKTKLDQIIADRNSKKGAIEQIVAGLNTLGIDPEHLESGEVVLSFSIPRESVDDDFKSFCKELRELEKDLFCISSTVKEESRGFKIKSLSSTDLSVVLNINIDVAEIILYAIAGLQVTLWQISDKEKAASIFKDAPKELKDKMKEWVGGLIAERVQTLYAEIKKEFKNIIKQEEYERLEGKIKDVLNSFARKIQKRYTLDINAGEIIDDQDETDQDKDGEPGKELQLEKLRKGRINYLSKKSSELKIMQAQQSEMLSLPEPEESTSSEQEESSVDAE